MNSPGCGVRRDSPTGSRHNVAESALSTTRLRTRYGTGAMADAEGAAPAARSLIAGHLVHLRGDVDAGGAPGDASATADAARHAELVVPRAQFVGQPMAITRRAGLADAAAAVDVGEVELETRRPVTPALGVLTGEVADVLGAGAKAGRAHHRAVAAGQAAAGDLVPLRRLAGTNQQLPQIRVRHLAAHPMRGGLDIVTRTSDFVPIGDPVRHRRKDVGAFGSADLDEVRRRVTPDALRQGQVVARSGRGAGAHRCA